MALIIPDAIGQTVHMRKWISQTWFIRFLRLSLAFVFPPLNSDNQSSNSSFNAV
jgi:hypothetical protein